MKQSLPAEFVQSGVAKAETMTLFGAPLKDLTREELLAAAAHGWAKYHEHIEHSIDRSIVLREMMARRA